jgi:hypothetical protein
LPGVINPRGSARRLKSIWAPSMAFIRPSPMVAAWELKMVQPSRSSISAFSAHARDRQTAHQRDGKDLKRAVHHGNLVVPVGLIARAVHLARHDGGVEGLGIGDLGTGPGPGLVLQRLQGGVVPAAFPGRRQARFLARVKRAVERDAPARRR